MGTSADFVTGSEIAAAWGQVKECPGPVRLERQVGMDSPWREVPGVATLAAVRRYVRALDRAPIPGRFRLVKG